MPLPRKAILLLLDSLPLGELGCYGGFRERTAGFDRLAAKGAVFENAFAPVVTDADSAFDEQGPWSAVWHAFADGFRDRGVLLEEIVCTTLAELADAAASERVEAFLHRSEPGLLVISGPELVPPPVHGHLAVVDDAVATLHATIEKSAAETLFIVGALQGGGTGESVLANEEHADGDTDEDVGQPTRLDGTAEVSFPRLVAQRVNVPLLVRPAASLVPGLRVQALVTTTDIVATLEGWLTPTEPAPSDAGLMSHGGFSLLPLVTCEREAVRNEVLIRGPGEIALRTPDRYVVIRLDGTASTPREGPGTDRRSGDGLVPAGHEGNLDGRFDAADIVAVFRKPEDVWDRLDVGNTMPEERDMLVGLCRKLFAESSN